MIAEVICLRNPVTICIRMVRDQSNTKRRGHNIQDILQWTCLVENVRIQLSLTAALGKGVDATLPLLKVIKAAVDIRPDREGLLLLSLYTRRSGMLLKHREE